MYVTCLGLQFITVVTDIQTIGAAQILTVSPVRTETPMEFHSCVSLLEGSER